jgi:hypothetical protein
MSIDSIVDYSVKITVHTEVFDKQGELVYEKTDVHEQNGDSIKDAFNSLIVPKTKKEQS